jgi:hypothetical protein
MGRWKAWALAWLLAATLSALLLQAPSARGEELLVNGGFEEAGADGQPVGWRAAGGEVQRAEGLGRGGSSAGEFATDSNSHHYVGQCVPAWEGNAYTFQGYAATPSERPMVSVFLLIQWYGEPECYGQPLGTTGDTAEAVILEPPDVWHFLALQVSAAPAGTRSARVGIVIEQSNATVYLDDFSFTGSARRRPPLALRLRLGQSYRPRLRPRLFPPPRRCRALLCLRRPRPPRPPPW